MFLFFGGDPLLSARFFADLNCDSTDLICSSNSSDILSVIA
jgi:hypothetical protein